MKRTMYEKLKSYAKPTLWGGALVGLLFAVGATAIGDVTPEGKRLRAQNRDAFGLFAGPTAVLRGNLLQCGVDNQGNVCTDVFNSPTGGGGFWPTGSVDQYIFNTGLQIAGVNSDEAGPWSGDTVAAYFFDARGTQQHSAPLSDVFDSQNSDDLANWPAEAIVSDPDLFNPVLLGRQAASQQDSWTQYWDGDPNRVANRKHPMGVQVTQRSLSWNFPSGNESVIYFIYDFANVTNDPEFQRINELQFFAGQNSLPDAGWRIDDFYASFSTDMDVTSNAGNNFSTAVLSFDLGLSYTGDFLDPTFVYPSNLFKPPFFLNSPGIVGVKYLRSPIDPNTGQEVGLTLFSNTQNPSSPGAQFIDPLGDEQLWRYLSGNLVPALGDPPCNVEPTTPTDRPVCFVFQQAADTRFYQSSGPTSVEAGAAATIVVSYIVAATVASLPDGTPSGIIANAGSPNANPPGFPSFHPGFASQRGCNANGQNCTVNLTAVQNAVQPIEKGAGWYRYMGPAPASGLESASNKLDQFSVEVVPESLLGKALVAQTIFDNKFLLGFAPEPPPFFLAPADGNVTVLWNKSATEREGDPFFAVASDSTSALFNPNYREFDVEGYRVLKGTAPDNLELLGSFDYATTEFADFTCETVLPEEDVGVVININGVPTSVVGYASGEPCPLATSPLSRNIGPGNSLPTGQTFTILWNNGGGGGTPGGGVVRLLTGGAQAVQLDTALADQPVGLQNNGVPFVFVDQAVTNNFTYFYSVTAFDVNSEASGPISLTSAVATKQAVPRAFAPNLTVAFDAVIGVTGDDGVLLDVTQDNVQPDPVTGIFPGPQPPTNSTEFVLVPDPSLVGGLLQAGGLSGVIDSVVPGPSANTGCPVGTNALGGCWTLYMSFDNGTSVSQTVTPAWTPVWDSFSDPDFTEFSMGSGLLPWNDEALQRYGIPAGFGAGVAGSVSGHFGMSINYSDFEGQANRRALVAGSVAGGSRWFDGTTETAPNPTLFIGAGGLAGIDSVWKPVHHTPIDVTGVTYPASGAMQCFGYTLATIGRAADVRVTWGGNTFTEVRDVTHNVNVPFNPNARASYGFLTTDANGNGFLDWQDFDYLDGLAQNAAALGFCTFLTVPPTITLAPDPVMMATSTQGNSLGSMSATGQGFALYINAERYIFETSGFPSDGTVWTLRTYTGIIGSGGTDSAPTDYELTTGDSGEGANRPPLIPGLQFNLTINEAGLLSSGLPDLNEVHVVPDPYLASSRFDLAPTEKQMMFVNMPVECTLRIYSLTGVLIRSINYRDKSGGGRLVWDMRNRDNQFIASGVYFFVVTTPDGREHVGKFTVVNFGGQN